jgi:hypothetical protein
MAAFYASIVASIASAISASTLGVIVDGGPQDAAQTIGVQTHGRRSYRKTAAESRAELYSVAEPFVETRRQDGDLKRSDTGASPTMLLVAECVLEFGKRGSDRQCHAVFIAIAMRLTVSGNRV